MRCADYLAEYFSQQGVDRVFMVTGGGAMHLNDAFGRHGGLRHNFLSSRASLRDGSGCLFPLSGRPAVVQVTTGPGQLMP